MAPLAVAEAAALPKAIIAFVARCTPQTPETGRKYTIALIEQIRVKLAEDKTLTLLSSTVVEEATKDLAVPGFASDSAELEKISKRMPADCNILIVAGPYTTTDMFNIGIARKDLLGARFGFGPIKEGSQPKFDQADVIRMDIDAVLKSMQK